MYYFYYILSYYIILYHIILYYIVLCLRCFAEVATNTADDHSSANAATGSTSSLTLADPLAPPPLVPPSPLRSSEFSFEYTYTYMYSLSLSMYNYTHLSLSIYIYIYICY